MSAIASTIRWDNEEKKTALERIARRKEASLNALVNHWADVVIHSEAAEASFRAAAARGNPKRLKRLLQTLDAQDEARGIAKTKP